MHELTCICLPNRYVTWLVMLLMILAMLLVFDAAHAQADGQVEELTGLTEPGKGVFYTLADLKEGDVLTVYANGTSGNLDPFVALADAELDRTTLAEDFNTEINQAIAAEQDPIAAIADFATRHFLMWDDDSGEGYAAAFELTIPADGDYHLLLISTPSKDTFGHYRLLVGLNAPQVLTGDAEPTGALIAVVDRVHTRSGITVEQLSGTLSEDITSTVYTLNDFEPGDTLYVFAEAISGNLRPVVTLEDFGNKPLASGNFSGQQTTALLEHTFNDGGDNFKLEIAGCCEGETITTGDYRLLVGVNQPDVLTGNATPTGDSVLQNPTEVMIGLKMQQITDVDQKAENFSAVVSLTMEWTDPALAFSPDTCNCNFHTMTPADFIDYTDERDTTWPAFTLYNQQGNRWSQNQLVVVNSDGRATYFERFTTTFQAPDFDFRRFPFDTQQFYIRVDLLYPEEFYYYVNMEDFSEIGQQLGEEEWVIIDSSIDITSEIANTRAETSRYSFGFRANRHLSFYIFRIFVPLGIIILVSWIIFFLKDYGKRVEAASANLLLFIAFNFTISNDLPRLGYLTFLDSMLVSTFFVTGLVLVFNVYLKRLEVEGKTNMAYTIDNYTLWIYPVAYIVAFGLVSYFFA
jgi:hypothetical protein